MEVGKMTMIDRKFNINQQALAVLEYLDREPNFLPYVNGRYSGASFYTKPWYNGRERGVVISMSMDNGGKTINVAFFEHRNSDSICALRWETKQHYWNHPLEDVNIFGKAYGGGDKWDVAHKVSYGEVSKMADWVYDEIEKFYNANSKAEGN
jgi:hypothetical protein